MKKDTTEGSNANQEDIKQDKVSATVNLNRYTALSFLLSLIGSLVCIVPDLTLLLKGIIALPSSLIAIYLGYLHYKHKKDKLTAILCIIAGFLTICWYIFTYYLSMWLIKAMYSIG